jgi:pyruvate formate lyase activating enzyme
MSGLGRGLPGAPFPQAQLPAAPASRPGWRIAGLEPSSLLDFPGHLSAVIFLGGCNLDCGYCHNRGLIAGVAPRTPGLSPVALEQFLAERRDFLDGIVVTGGEPTLSPGLPELLARIKSFCYKVKLDTNGSRPDVLAVLLHAGLVDFLAIDVKAPLSDPALYAEVCGLPESRGAALVAALRRSLELARRWADAGDDREYELRTTCCPELGEADLELIGCDLAGHRAWAWQAWRDPATGRAPQTGHHTAGRRPPLGAATLARRQPGAAARYGVGRVFVRG